MIYFGRTIGLALASAAVLSTAAIPTSIPRDHPPVATQSAATSGAATNSAILAVGTRVVTKLLTNLDSRTCKPGDTVEAEIARDVSQDHKVVVKAGSRVIGHVVALDASSTHTPETRIAISFTAIAKKGGETAPISFVIQAIAIAPGLKDKNEIQEGGRPAEAAAIIAATAGGSIGGPLSEGLLRPEDSGVYGIPGLSLAVMTTETGSQFPVLKSPSESIRLPKGTQMLLRVAQN